MSNFRKFVSMSAVAILGVTNLLTPLSYASAASDYDSLNIGSQGRSFSFLMPNHHVTLYAVTEPNHYKIEYSLNSGTHGVSHPTGAVYDTSFEVSVPSRTGYTFSGWDISGMDSTSHTVGGSPSTATGATGVTGTEFENLTSEDGATVSFAARWNAASSRYKVHHELQNIDNDGYTRKTEDTQELTGTTDKDVSPTPKTYVGFTTPSPQTGTITADGNLEIVYQYDRKTFDLTLIPGRGIADVSASGSRNLIDSAPTQTTQKFKYGEQVNLSFTPKQGYENAGWDIESQFNMPASALTGTASATPITYTITYYTKGGTVSGAANPESYNIESSKITLNNPTRPHSQFAGWTGTDLSSGTITVEIPKGSIGNRSYTATWTCDTGYDLTGTSCGASTGVTYTVNHYKADLSGNYNNISETTTQSGTTDDYTNATAQDYEGFEVDGSVEEKKINGDGSTVVDIYYKRKQYTLTITNTPGVTVTAIGDHPTGTNLTYKFGDTVTVTATTGAGYKFESWTVTNASVVNAVAPNTTFTMPAKNVTINADVTPIEYTITYELHNGSATNPTTYTVVTDTFTLNDPTRLHSQFAGWTGADVTSGTSVTISKGSVGNKSYEAMWTCDLGYHANGDSCVANNYNVELVYGDGHGTAETIVYTYDQLKSLPNPEQTGYTFKGWVINGMSGGVEHRIGSITVTGDTYTYNADGGSGINILNLTTEEGSTVRFTAIWEGRTDTDYVVYHYYKELGEDTYELKETQELTGTTDYELVFNTMIHNITGFTYSAGYLTGGVTRPTSGAVASTTINPYGTTTVYLYYTRNKYNVTLSGDSNVHSLSRTGPREFEYGATVEVSATPKTGYHFKHWTES